MADYGLPPRTRITGVPRARTGKTIAAAYRDGATIRDLVGQTGRSYGFIHRILQEEGVKMRPRGGANKH